VQIVARLAEGVSPEAGRGELAAIVSTLATVSEADRTRRPVVMPLNEAYFGSALQPVPMMMLAAVGIVLVIACSHAASLLLARASARSREMSMRAALGASRSRIVRQLLVESVLLALLAGVLGIAIATSGLRLFANETAGFGMPYWARFTFDLQLLGYVSLLCLATGVGFGLLPALQLSKTNLADTLNQGGRSGMTSARGRRTTTVLLVGELALTVTLLAGAGALVQSANVVYRADHTIDLANLWEYRVALPQPQYAAGEKRLEFYRRLDERLAAAPAVESAALSGSMPFNARESRAIRMDNETPEPAGGNPATGSSSGPGPTARLVAIGNRYFDTLGLTVIRGRRLEELDASTRSSSALVNERFAERFSPGVDAIGRQVVLVNERAPDRPAERFTIVGIAPALRQQVAAGETPVVYVPHETQPAATGSLIIRGNPEQFAEVLRQEVRRIDPDLPLFNLESLERISYNSRWIQRILSTAFSAVAIIAVILSSLGLYALTAYSTTQRTQEVGVRMALGATRTQVLWLFLRRALFQVAIGLAIGLAGAVALGTVLQGALVEVRANNPLTLAGVAILLVGISIAASLLPARKAARLDPVNALRAD
jgi:putative ABC transport system permease protein